MLLLSSVPLREVKLKNNSRPLFLAQEVKLLQEPKLKLISSTMTRLCILVFTLREDQIPDMVLELLLT